jgi:hypothetical protein
MYHTHPERSRFALLLVIAFIALAFPLLGASSSAPYTVAPTDRNPRPQLGNYGTNVDGSWHDHGPQVNKPFTNVFGLREVRVTDGMVPGGIEIGDGWRGPTNWWTTYFSQPGTFHDPTSGGSITGYLMTVTLDGADNRLFILDPKTMSTYPYCEPTWPNCQMPYAGSWSYNVPGLMYFASGSMVESYNYATNLGPEVVYDFSQCPGALPNNGGYDQLGEVFVSHDESTITVSIGNSMMATYNRNTGACHWLSTSEGMTDAGPASLQPWPAAANSTGFSMHNATISANGSWVMVEPGEPVSNCSGSVNCSIFWQAGTSTTTLCTIFGGCAGHMALGQNKAFYVISAPATNGVSVPAHYDFGLFSMSNPTGGNYHGGPYIRLHPTGPPYFNQYAPNTECNVSDTHPDWNTSDAQPIIVSSFVDQLVPGFSLTQIHCAWDHEIDAVASDGSGTTWRFAHNRASGLANQLSDPDTSYNALSMPVCSSDGKYCMWATDWNGALGTQTANTTIGGYYCTLSCAWQPKTYYKRGQEILGGFGNEQVAIQAGTSGPTLPVLNPHNGGITHDGTVVWENQPGCNTAETLPVAAGGSTLGKGLCRTDVFIVEAK